MMNNDTAPSFVLRLAGMYLIVRISAYLIDYDDLDCSSGQDTNNITSPFGTMVTVL